MLRESSVSRLCTKISLCVDGPRPLGRRDLPGSQESGLLAERGGEGVTGLSGSSALGAPAVGEAGAAAEVRPMECSGNTLPVRARGESEGSRRRDLEPSKTAHRAPGKGGSWAALLSRQVPRSALGPGVRAGDSAQVSSTESHTSSSWNKLNVWSLLGWVCSSGLLGKEWEEATCFYQPPPRGRKMPFC